MIVKFHSRGKGGGSGPMNYLLGKDRDREGARVLRGNPEQTVAIIDSLKFAKKYTSVTLSFAESELPGNSANEIMDSFEKALFAGLDSDQYDITWVEHLDKGRVELNAVIPTVELTTGKRLQPYYDRADRARIDAYQTAINTHYGFADPNDPLRARPLVTPNNLPKATQKAQEAITAGLLSMAGQGLVSSRKDVTEALRAGGYEIARETKSSISIKNPEGGRNIRLKGALYTEHARFGEDLRAEIEAAGERYREAAAQRLRDARKTYTELLAKKREYNQQRFRRATEPAQEAPALDASMAASMLFGGDFVGNATVWNSMVSKPGQVQIDTGLRQRRRSSLGELRGDAKAEENNVVHGGLDDRTRDNAVRGCQELVERARGRAERARDCANRARERVTEIESTAATAQRNNERIGAFKRLCGRLESVSRDFVETLKQIRSLAIKRDRGDYSPQGPSM